MLLRVLGRLFGLLPIDPDRIVLATARLPTLEGNLAAIHEAIRRRAPHGRVVLLLEPYSYGLLGKLAYLGRLVRGMYHLRRARLFIVDNAYLPIHVAPHRAGTTVVQVWHAVAAFKRFGLDTAVPPADPERRFLHRHYDFVVASGDAARVPYAAAFGVPVERVLALGTPRTDFFFDPQAMAAARERVLALYPALSGRRVVLHAPTFRGRGRGKRAATGIDAVRLRAALPDDCILALKTHPNLDPSATPTAGYDVVIDRSFEINDVFTATTILITDFSSSIFEFALLKRPIIVLTDDLESYERDPGLYLDPRSELIGTHVTGTDAVAQAILEDDFDLTAYDAFIQRHVGACDGSASDRLVARFVVPGRT